MRVGGNQTLSLALGGEDGRSYTFRSLDTASKLAIRLSSFRSTALRE